MNELKNCPYCGKPVYGFDNYCGGCGNMLVDEIVDEDVCAYCGGLIADKDVSCPHCGAKRIVQRRSYPQNVRLRACPHCGKRIPFKVKFCSCCGTLINVKQKRKLPVIFWVGMTLLGLFAVILILGAIAVAVNEHKSNVWESERNAEALSNYNEAQNAEFTEYDVDEIAKDMGDERFSDNYKAKYKDKYLCVTGVIADMGYNGQRVLLEPLDDANLRYMAGKRIQCDFYDGYSGAVAEEFSKTYIKGDIVRIYGKVTYVWDTSFTIMAFKAEKNENTGASSAVGG